MKNNGSRLILQYIILTVLLLIEGGECIRLDEVSVPRYKLNGQNVELTCNFQLENDTLYAVKWYFDESEFYRYLPENTPPKVIFNMTGITVNVSMSDYRKVYLENLDMNSTGIYRCEVSAEAPTFATVSGEGKLEVISIWIGGPYMSVENKVYKMGEDLFVNCTTSPMYPEGKLVWYINDYTVEYLSFDRNRTLLIDPITNLVYWSSRIRIPLSPKVFDKGETMLVSCITHVSPTPWKGHETQLAILQIKEAKIIVTLGKSDTPEHEHIVNVTCPVKERSNLTFDSRFDEVTEDTLTSTEILPTEFTNKTEINCEGRIVMSVI